MRLLHQNIHRRSSAGATLLLAGNQLEAALNLYTTIIKARGFPAPELPDVVHKFCVTLLKPGDLPPSDALACVRVSPSCTPVESGWTPAEGI
jgi:hypothetical protein